MAELAMSELQRALIAKMLTLAVWRAAEDAESQVAHWLMERQANLADLVEARTRTVEAHKRHTAACKAYTALLPGMAGATARVRSAAAAGVRSRSRSRAGARKAAS